MRTTGWFLLLFLEVAWHKIVLPCLQNRISWNIPLMQYMQILRQWLIITIIISLKIRSLHFLMACLFAE